MAVTTRRILERKAFSFPSVVYYSTRRAGWRDDVARAACDTCDTKVGRTPGSAASPLAGLARPGGRARTRGSAPLLCRRPWRRREGPRHIGDAGFAASKTRLDGWRAGLKTG